MTYEALAGYPQFTNLSLHLIAEGPWSFDIPAKTNTRAKKMAHDHAAALGSLTMFCMGGITPSSDGRFKSQNLNSSSQDVMGVESDRSQMEFCGC